MKTKCALVQTDHTRKLIILFESFLIIFCTTSIAHVLKSSPVVISPEHNLAYFSELPEQPSSPLLFQTSQFCNTFRHRLHTLPDTCSSSSSNTAGWRRYHTFSLSFLPPDTETSPREECTNKNPACVAVNTLHGSPELQMGRGFFFSSSVHRC